MIIFPLHGIIHSIIHIINHSEIIRLFLFTMWYIYLHMMFFPWCLIHWSPYSFNALHVFMLIPTTRWIILEWIPPRGWLLMYIVHNLHRDSFLLDLLHIVFKIIVVFIHGFGDVGHVYLHGHHIRVILDFDMVGWLLQSLEGQWSGQGLLRSDCGLRSNLGWWNLLILIWFDWSYTASLTSKTILSRRLLAHSSNIRAPPTTYSYDWIHEIQIEFGIMLLLLFLFVGSPHRSWERIGEGRGKHSVLKWRWGLLLKDCVHCCFFSKGLRWVPRDCT